MIVFKIIWFSHINNFTFKMLFLISLVLNSPCSLSVNALDFRTFN